MEFIDWNGERLDFVSGLVGRPKPLISTGPLMIVRFMANGVSGLGYKAAVKFLTLEASKDSSLKPITDCGGLVDSFGKFLNLFNS